MAEQNKKQYQRCQNAKKINMTLLMQWDSKTEQIIVLEWDLNIDTYRVQITNEKICSNIQTLLVLGSL